MLASFNARRVEFLIVGGYPLAFHGAPRFTRDLEILVRPDAANARRVLAALQDFGFGAPDLTPADFERPDQVIQLGVPPVRATWPTWRASGNPEGARPPLRGRCGGGTPRAPSRA